QPLLDALKSFVTSREMLLIADNFEQVAGAASQLTELLSTAERLKILVTSRVLLQVRSETEFVVQPLSPPTVAAAEINFETVAASGAATLFVERARSADPSFRLTEENAPAVAEICNRLDGLPLAIELAAARVRVLSPRAIAEKLQHGFRLLKSGNRNLPERQQTMHAAVDWSYRLLSDEDQEMFRSVSVFSGGFRIEAAEAVCRCDEDENSILDRLASLIDHSLLVRRDDQGGEPRFQMLEVVRDFAHEAAEEAGEATTLHRRHAEFFTALSEDAEPFFQTDQSAEWLDRLEEDHDNLRAAVLWSGENAQDLAFRLAASLRNFWIVHGHLSEGLQWLKTVTERGDAPPELRFKIINGLGLAARFAGDFETAEKAYREGLQFGEHTKDHSGLAIASRGAGLVAMQRGALATAREHFERGLELSRSLKDDFGVAMSLSFLGDLARLEGDYVAARPLFEAAAASFRELGRKAALGDALNNLGAATFNLGDYKIAAQHFDEAASIAENIGNKMTLSYSLDGFAALAAVVGEVERSARLMGAAKNLRESIGYKIEPAERRFRDEYFHKLEKSLSAEILAAETLRGREMSAVDAIHEARTIDVARIPVKHADDAAKKPRTSPLASAPATAPSFHGSRAWLWLFLAIAVAAAIASGAFWYLSPVTAQP
ncbi:MAG: tetratricopeptide repeat protein, partial [Acidobacteria bacterium]|nr:tetratricopeptide repeat protein [Acidobacteriota bacterium]